MATEQLIRVFENERPSKAACRGCQAPIEWYETLKGKRMPMNAGAVPRKSDNDPDTGRVIVFFAADDAHWNSCPDAAKFGKAAAR